MNRIKVDFSKVTGVMKALGGVCCAPYSIAQGNKQTLVDKYFKEGNIPFCRLHDCCGSYGGTYFVDVSNVFRDFSADENDPLSYDFHYTDEYIKSIRDTGCEVYYRLGETIEWGSKKYRTMPPADFKKWARICEHIILHYNYGWADGFNFDIRYWEIWNEPENPGNDNGPSMWGGTKEEFFELYVTAAKYLKNKFSEIYIGGYGSCGFYTETRVELPAGFEAFVPYFKDFLKTVKENGAPLDFFSWHIYTDDERELLNHAVFVRKTLDEYGFKDTESHLNEWNIHAEGHGFAAKHTMEGGSFNAAVLAMLQNTDYVDKAMYYCFSSMGIYNGFLNQNDKSPDVSWYSFVFYGKVYALGHCVHTEYDDAKRLYAVAASNGERSALIISNYKSEDEDVELDIKGIADGKKASVKYLSQDGIFEDGAAAALTPKPIKFKLGMETVALIEIS